MPDPRNILAYDGINADFVTVQADTSIVFDALQRGGSASVGLAVSLSANQTVGLALDGRSVYGKLQLVENDGRCNVQFKGYTNLPGGVGAALTPGTSVVGALGGAGGTQPGYIRNVAAAPAAYSQAAAAEAAGAGATEIVDATDPTNVVVLIA